MANPNPLKGYGSGIRKETLLGFVAWYGISDVDIRYEDLKAKFAELGLDEEAMPGEIRAVDAFKRACRYTQERKQPIPGTDLLANVMVRDVANDRETTERHIVIEIVDQQGRRLQYETAARLLFTRRIHKVLWEDEKGRTQERQFYLEQEAAEFMEDCEGDNVRRATIEKAGVTVDKVWTYGRHDTIVDSAIARFRQEFDRASQYLDSQSLRQMIRRQLDFMKAFLLRKNGSVYFIPKHEERRAIALAELHEWFGGGSSFHILPLIDTEKQREMIQAAFEDEVHEEALQMIHKLKDALTESKPITAGAWNMIQQRKNELLERARAYSDLIDREFAKAGTELALLDDTMAELLNQGLVKAG